MMAKVDAGAGGPTAGRQSVLTGEGVRRILQTQGILIAFILCLLAFSL